MTAELVEAIRREWGWRGIDPEAVTAISPFGHLIVRDGSGTFWYLDPEMRTLEPVATDEAGLIGHMNDPEVQEVWQAERFVEAAKEKLGEAPAGHCYAFPIHALIEGDFTSLDFWLPPVVELIGVMGSIERQLRDVPDGQAVQLAITD